MISGMVRLVRNEAGSLSHVFEIEKLSFLMLLFVDENDWHA